MSQPLQPLASFIKFGADGTPYLEGFKCSNCAAVLLEARRGCPRCAALGTLEPFRLADRGRLFSYTIVHRSFPGIETPFISAIVELDGGGFLKGNLVGVEPDPNMITFNMPVSVEFDQRASPQPGAGDLVRYVFRKGSSQ